MHPFTFHVIILELFFELLFVILDPELQEQIQLEVEKRHIESAVILGAPTRVEILTDFIKLGVVDFIAISHLHGDHFGGLPFFFLESLYQEPRSRPLILTGPPNLKKRVEMLHLAMFGELAERPMTFPVEYRELPPDQTTRVCGVDLVPFAVPHLEKEICFGCQAKLGDKALLYSGDCGWNEDLVRYSQGTDLFICECCYFGSQTPFHLSYPELRQERERLDCKRLLLSHLGREVLARQEEVALNAPTTAMWSKSSV